MYRMFQANLQDFLSAELEDGCHFCYSLVNFTIRLKLTTRSGKYIILHYLKSFSSSEIRDIFRLCFNLSCWFFVCAWLMEPTVILSTELCRSSQLYQPLALSFNNRRPIVFAECNKLRKLKLKLLNRPMRIWFFIIFNKFLIKKDNK